MPQKIQPSPLEQPSPSPNPHPRRWWSLHWFWLLPAIIVGTALCVALVGGVLMFNPIKLKLSRPYAIASERVRYDDVVIQALGDPVEEAVWLPDGQITTEDGRTDAWFDFDVAGPSGQANVYALMEKQGDTWVIKQIEIMLPGGQRRELEL